MLFGCRILLFVAWLISLAAATSSQGSTELICFDPECSTPYLLGEVITDLPEQSLRKGAIIEIFGQSALEESYRIKVGEHFYDVHSSFLRLGAKLHEPRSMVRVKLSRFDSSTVQPTGGGEKSVDFSTVSSTSDSSSAAKEITLSSKRVDTPSTQQNITPPPSEKGTSDYQFLQQQQQQQEHQQKPGPTVSQSSELPKETIKPSQPVQQQEGVPLSTLQATEGVNMRPSDHSSTLEKPRTIDETSASLSPLKTTVPGSRLETEIVYPPVGQHQLEQPYLSSEKATSDGRFMQQQEHQQKSGPTASQSPVILKETIKPSQPVQQQEGVPLSTLQATEDANMRPSDHSSTLEKPRILVETTSHSPSSEAKVPESGLETETTPPSMSQQRLQDSGPKLQSAESVRMQTSGLHSHASMPETNTASLHVEKHEMQQPSLEKLQSQKTNVDMKISSEPTIKTEEISPSTDQHRQQLNQSPLQEPVSQVGTGAKALSSDPRTVLHPNIEMGHSSAQNTQALEPHLKTVADQKSQYVQMQSHDPPKEEGEVSQSDQVVTDGSSDHQPKVIHHAESGLKDVLEINSQELATEAPAPGNTDHGRTNEFEEAEEPPSYTSLESHSPDLGELVENDEDPPLRPLMDIATESTFFHCLSYASNGTFMSPSIDSSSHIVKKSILAGAVLFFARQYFNAAQILLLKLPLTLVSSLDCILTFAFHLPPVFFIAWLLFLLSILTTWQIVKLFNRLLFIVLASSNPDDPRRRSLAEWLAVEENANLLAGSLADKEEAYARLIVWSTKVSERYEHQTRNHSTSETRIHNQLRDLKASLADSLQENKELRVTHDALVEQLSNVKTEAAATATRLRKEVAALNDRLEECTRQYTESIEKEKALLACEVNRHQSRAENAEKMVNELKEANQRFEEDRAARERELSSLREAFIELKSAELKKNKKNQSRAAKKCVAAAAEKQNEDKGSTGGWEVEDELDMDEIIEEIEGPPEQASEGDGDEVQSSLREFLEVGRLRVALEDSEKQARAEIAARKQETELRTQLQETVEMLKGENADLSQRLCVATEDCDASKKKLEILSEYFKEREAVLQRDLGRQALSESESMEELKFLRSKQESYEVEVKTLRDQLASARRELAESERVNRRHISELDKRLHENWLSARALENVVKDLRGENNILRQKMFTGERATIHNLLSGIPPPPPPPPPPAVALATTKLPEMRSTSRQSEKSVGSHPQIYPPPPPSFLPFPQIPLTGPGGSQFIPPIPPPPPSLPNSLLSQRQQEANRQVPLVAVPTSQDAAQSSPKLGSNTSESNRFIKQQLQHH
ncbi:melanoma inhibitory activity protein 3 [Echinococcus multilocularis]|uniref:Melanoma inhibitory activity protein 3 n=1 Tax=Echinococcus multilocularis TaxID=6211 RepID=A0A068YBP9_ECHMU|nr:melanoma inhibitory activity protein 3 [Echinococcus multilocularis]